MMSRLAAHNSGTVTRLSLMDQTPYSATTHFWAHHTVIREDHLGKGTLRARVGVALQKQRQSQGLSQGQLGSLSDLSLKYIGEIERGEANVSLETLERIAVALEWDPFEAPLREQDMLPEGIRTLLLAELTHMQHLVQTAIGWVQTLDAAMARRAAQPPPGQHPPPLRQVGRPRKPRPDVKPEPKLEARPDPKPEIPSQEFQPGRESPQGEPEDSDPEDGDPES